MLLGIQILGVLFALGMLYLTFLQQKRKELSGKEYVFWVFVWIIFIVITVFPNILEPVIKTLNIVRIMDMLVILGFLFVIGVLFYNYLNLRKVQKKVESLVSKMAVKEEEKK